MFTDRFGSCRGYWVGLLQVYSLTAAQHSWNLELLTIDIQIPQNSSATAGMVTLFQKYSRWENRVSFCRGPSRLLHPAYILLPICCKERPTRKPLNEGSLWEYGTVPPWVKTLGCCGQRTQYLCDSLSENNPFSDEAANTQTLLLDVLI